MQPTSWNSLFQKKTLDYVNVLVIDQTIRWSKMIIQLG